MAEGLSVALRTETLRGDAIHGRIQEINAELLRAGLYLDEADQQLATSYIKAVENVQALVSSSDDPDAKAEFRLTGAIPASVTQKIQKLGEAQERATELRDRLIRRIRIVLTVEEASDRTSGAP